MRADIEKLYVASKVKRWHTHHGPSQNLAEHSFGVAMIIAAWHPDPSSALLKAALYHDLHEKRFADIPWSTKREHRELPNIEEVARQSFLGEVGLFDFVLSDEDALWLKFADQYEAYLYLCHADFVLGAELLEIRAKCYTIVVRLRDELCELGFFQPEMGTVH